MQGVEWFLEQCVKHDGSDLHFKTDTGKAYIRVHGDLIEVEAPHYTDEEFRVALFKLLKPVQSKKLDKDLELDFSFEVPGLSRFRGNAYQQRGHLQAAFRVIPYTILGMEDLLLPPATYDFIQKPRGLVLVTGPAGSGKSTSLAAMMDRINRTQPLHIMTVEDPIEFVHGDHVALINQRELDIDTISFTNALKYVLRQDPDVILVGEMRDLETIHLAITAAETGHLVFATLHTVDAVQTVDRIIDVFPIHQQQQIRMQLSVNLVGVLSQTLVRRKDGRGRVAAHEILVCNGAVRNLIRENKTYQIGSLIQTGSRQKMQSLDQSLALLVDKSIVEREDARMRAKDPMEFDRLLAISSPQTGSKVPQSAFKPIADLRAQAEAQQVGQIPRPGFMTQSKEGQGLPGTQGQPTTHPVVPNRPSTFKRSEVGVTPDSVSETARLENERRLTEAKAKEEAILMAKLEEEERQTAARRKAEELAALLSSQEEERTQKEEAQKLASQAAQARLEAEAERADQQRKADELAAALLAQKGTTESNPAPSDDAQRQLMEQRAAEKLQREEAARLADEEREAERIAAVRRAEERVAAQERQVQEGSDSRSVFNRPSVFKRSDVGVTPDPVSETAQLETERRLAEEKAKEEAELMAQLEEEERLSAQTREAERLEAEKLEAARLEAEATAEAERIRVEEARVAAETLEAQRLEAEKLEAARLEAEATSEAERIRVEEARLAAETLEAERSEAEKLEAAKLEAAKLEAAKLEAAKLEAEAAAEAERVRLEEERLAAERLEAERLEAEKLEAAKLEAEAAAEAERVRLEEERWLAETLEAERVEAERLEAARLKAEAEAEKVRIEEERWVAEALEAERLAAERLEAVRLKAEAEAEKDRIEEERWVAAERRLEEQRLIAEQKLLAQRSEADQIAAQEQAAHEKLVEERRLAAAQREAARLEALAEAERDRIEEERWAASQQRAAEQRLIEEQKIIAQRNEADQIAAKEHEAHEKLMEERRLAAIQREIDRKEAEVQAEKERIASEERRRLALQRQVERQAEEVAAFAFEVVYVPTHDGARQLSQFERLTMQREMQANADAQGQKVRVMLHNPNQPKPVEPVPTPTPTPARPEFQRVSAPTSQPQPQQPVRQPQVQPQRPLSRPPLEPLDPMPKVPIARTPPPQPVKKVEPEEEKKNAFPTFKRLFKRDKE